MSCGVGVQYREVLCVARTSNGFMVSPSSGCSESRPPSEQVCRTVRLHSGMVHLGLVEGKSRLPRIYDRRGTVTLSGVRYKYRNLLAVLGDVRHRRANQNGPMHPGGCRRRQLLGSLETDGTAAVQPGPLQEGPPTIVQPTA